MRKSTTPESEQFQQDMNVVAMLEKLVYPKCDECGYDWRDHRQEGVLPMPSSCAFADRCCGTPAVYLHHKRLKEAMETAFGEHSHTEG